MRRWMLGAGLLAATVGVAGAVGACGDDGETGAGGGGEGGDPTTTATTGPAVVSTGTAAGSPLGATCDTDADCGADFECLGPSDDVVVFGGGPANGYCSKACSTDTDCPSGVCFGTGADARCVESCTLGQPTLEFLDSELDPSKCHGRGDVRCQTVGGEDICVPTCHDDSQCSGRSCDPRFTVCVDTPTAGDVTGDACDPDSTEGTCEGVCVSFTDGPSMCSQYCVLGDADLSLECGGLEAGLCVFSPSTNELGDAGFCTEACSEQDDCLNPDFWCFPVGGITGAAVTNGFCFAADDCPCADAGTTCTDTIYGPKCLDLTFPLGDAGVGGGGQGGAGGAGGGGQGGAGGGQGGAGGAGGGGGAGGV